MLDILSVHLDTLHPLVGDVKDFKFGNRSVADIIRSCFPEQLLSSVVICGNFIPSPHIAKLLMGDLPRFIAQKTAIIRTIMPREIKTFFFIFDSPFLVLL